MINLLYTKRGFPVLVESQAEGAVFESPEVTIIHQNRSAQDRPGFETELKQIAQLSSIWSITGGLFAPILHPKAVVSPSVKSFVLESARLLTGQSKRRLVSFSDLTMLVEYRKDMVSTAPGFSGTDYELLATLAKEPTESVIQKWVTTIGVDDLSMSMQLVMGS